MSVMNSLELCHMVVFRCTLACAAYCLCECSICLDDNDSEIQYVATWKPQCQYSPDPFPAESVKGCNIDKLGMGLGTRL